jgi:hypothetical protein
MDMHNPLTLDDQIFLNMAEAVTQQKLQRGQAMTPQEAMQYLEHINGLRAQQHREAFPFSDNLFTLIFIVLADLNETQRERLTTHLSLRGLQVPQYRFGVIREAMIELFCAPRSSLEWPGYRTTTVGVRSFCVLEEGTMDDVDGFWVEDNETQDLGFLCAIEDEFWMQDEASGAWVVRRFRGRRLRRGFPKGKGKGKGRKGYRRFIPRQKGKGKSLVHLSSFKGKSKGKKGKGKKGKPGGNQDTGKGPGQAHVVADATESQQEATAAYPRTENVDEWQEPIWYEETYWTPEA